MKKNKKGFTLAELLIVVAIIGVLVAVSIPIFTAQLEKAREATDLANLRAAYAEGVAGYLDNDKYTGGYYNIGTGTIGSDKVAALKGTGTKGSDSNKITIGGYEYNPETDYSGKAIKISVTDGVVTLGVE